MKSGPLVAFLFSMMLFSLVVTRSLAGNGGWITNYVVRDLKTGVPVEEKFEGAEYNITLTINVTSSAPNAMLRLYTSLERSKLIDRYWELHSTDYPGINLSTWNPNPNRNYVEFSQEIGALVVSCYGKVPDDITIREYGEITLHKAVNYSVVELRDGSNNLLDRINFTVIDSEINEYENLLSDKKDLVAEMRNSKVVAQYIQLSEDIIDKAEREANEGFVDKAKILLNMIPSSVNDLPKERSPSFMETMFIPVAGGLSAALILFAVLFLRSKGQLSYVLRVLEDQIKDLEGLTLKASRVDKSISARLETVKDRLKRLVGV